MSPGAPGAPAAAAADDPPAGGPHAGGISAASTQQTAPPGRADGKEYLRLIGLGALIGIPAALLAAVFLALVHELQHWLWTDLPRDLDASGPPWYLVIGLPVLGAGIVVLVRRLLPGDGGNPPLEGIGGKQPLLAYGPGVALAAIGTLSFGAVLGPEAPLIALGAVAGLGVSAFARLAPRERGVLASAGSFSAVSALFGGPIVGGLLMIEGGLDMGAALIPALLPGFVAAALGYVLFVGLGNWGGLRSQGLAVPGLPPYQGTHITDLLLAIVVGIVAALLITAVRRAAARLAEDGLRHGSGRGSRRGSGRGSGRGFPRLPMPALLLAGGLAVGLIAQTADWLGANSQDVLFSGQTSLPSLVAQSSTKIVLLLILAKALGYAVSLGCGYRGGPVFPAIFLGVAIATLLVVWFSVSTTLAVAIGTAAGMTATSRLLLAPIVFSALLVGVHGVDTVPAAVLAAVASWLTVHMLDRRASQSAAG